MKIEKPYVGIEYPVAYNKYTFKEKLDEICNSFIMKVSSEILRQQIKENINHLCNQYVDVYPRLDLNFFQNFEIKYENEDDKDLETDYSKINIIPDSKKSKEIWRKLLNSSIKL